LHDIIVAGYNGEVWDFQEKPDIPSPIPFDPAHAYASTGNYVFDADVLVGCLTEVAQHGEADLGRALLPQLVHTRLAFAYDFSSNGMPGTPPNEELYWRNIEIMQAYFDATRDVEGAAPRFRLHNVRWPILAQQGRSVPETQTAWLSRLDMLQPANTLVYH
jgi:glucose-1-phosphate adenylyltransferase